MTPTEPIRLGARTSPLARAQVALVGAALTAHGVPWTFVGVTTRGDVDGRPLTEIGGTGVFVGAVRDALRAGTIDVAVHSLKDLPTMPADDLEVVAIPEREDTRDVLIGRRLADLTDGVRVGTGSPRRAMQLLGLGGPGRHRARGGAGTGQRGHPDRPGRQRRGGRRGAGRGGAAPPRAPDQRSPAGTTPLNRRTT